MACHKEGVLSLEKFWDLGSCSCKYKPWGCSHKEGRVTPAALCVSWLPMVFPVQAAELPSGLEAEVLFLAPSFTDHGFMCSQTLSI